MTVENLARLIQSLSGAEKRHFKMTTRKQGGEKDYLGLFEIIEQHDHAETHTIKERFARQYPQSVIYNTTRYLFKLLTDSLIQAKMEKDTVFSIFQDIMRVKILQERSLHEDAHDLLNRIKHKTSSAQQHLLEYYVRRLELDYLSESKLFQLEDQWLIENQMKAKDILKTLHHIHDHHSLFELLKYRLLHSGKVSSDKEKKRLNDLILSEMILVSGKSKNSFPAQKLHLLFQSFFFTDIGDDHSALQTFYALNTLFENNLHLLDKPPLDYLLTLNGILDSLHTLKQFEKIPFFLEKLHQLDSAEYPEYFRWRVRKGSLVYQLILYCQDSRFVDAVHYWQQTGQAVLKQYPLINEERQWELYFYSSLAYYGIGSWKKAHAGIHQAMTQHKMQSQWLVCKAIRLLDIIIYYEQGDTDYLEYEIRSYRRFFRKKDALLQSENLLFKFIAANPAHSQKRLPEKTVRLFERELSQVTVDKYENHLLKYFDYLAWIRFRVK